MGVGNFSRMSVFQELPRMVLTGQRWAVAAGIMSQQAMTMRADIQECMDLALEIADNDRSSEQLDCQKVAVFRQVFQRSHHVPARRKQLRQFFLMLVRTGIKTGPQDVRQSGLIDEHQILLPVVACRKLSQSLCVTEFTLRVNQGTVRFWFHQM